jgi:hypothetical protein
MQANKEKQPDYYSSQQSDQRERSDLRARAATLVFLASYASNSKRS